MTPPPDLPDGSPESGARRRFMQTALGAAAAIAAIPAVSTVASAHFPSELAVDIEPGSAQNRVDPNEDSHITVAVLYTEFENGDGERVVFDPTERAVRYRFGAQSHLERGSGVHPVDDGEVRDVDGDGNDDLVLRFPLDGAGFTTDGGMGTLFWERDNSGKHGLAGSDTLTLTDETYASDIDVLNYALSLEHLEYAFYRDALASSDGAFDEWDVEGSAVGRYFGRPTLRFSVYQHLEDIRDQEKDHVDMLSRTINDLGGIPLDATEYHFGDAYESVANFVSVAARLENIGVSAYAGAAPLLSNPDLLPPALSIHSVEARHASYLDHLNLDRAVPNAFDPARSIETVTGLTKQFTDQESEHE